MDKISVIASADHAHSEELKNQVVIVLDVFRATSFIVTALAYGAKRVIPTLSATEAKRWYRAGRLLAGERRAKPIPGFHLGNSPTALHPRLLKGKDIVLTTSNGTKAIAKAKSAAHLLIGSFLNLTACSQQAVRLGREIKILCAGTHGKFSLEDGIAAGGLIDLCMRMNPTIRCDDLGMMARQSYHTWRRKGWYQLKASSSGRRVSALGYESDLDFCLQVDRFPLVPLKTNNGIILKN